MRSAIERLAAFYRLQVRLVRTWRLGPGALLRRVVLTTLVAFVALGATVVIVPGISVSTDLVVLLAVLAITLVNALFRPVLLALVIPLGIAAVALVGTAFQVVVVLLIARLVPGLHVHDLTAAIEGAVLFSALNTAISWFVSLGEDQSYYGQLVRLLIRDRAHVEPTDVPGVVFIQIDGLSLPALSHEIRAGRVPTISRWIRSGSHRLTGWECQLPSQTSSSQAGILLGSNDGIPAFRWYEKAAGRLMVSNRAADAAEIERRLGTERGLLRDGGTSIGNLFSGGAAESILTMSKLTDRVASLGPTRSWFYFFMSPFSFGRSLFLTLGEAGKEVWQARRQQAAGIEPRIERGGVYPLLRAITNVLLRQVSASLVIERILEGRPTIYVDFVDYDEIAHHAGPERAEALDALEGIDRVLGTIERSAAEAPRPYRFVVLSDHGQSLGATFRQRYGLTLEQLIAQALGQEASVHAATSTVEAWGPVNLLLSEASQGVGIGSRLTGRALRSRTREGSVELGPGSRERATFEQRSAAGTGGGSGTATASTADVAPVDDGATSADEQLPGSRPELVVCASGNLALVYLDRGPGRMTLEAIGATYPGLVEKLAGHEGVGFVLVRSAQYGPIVLGRSGCTYLADGRVEGIDPLAPFGRYAADDLRRLDAMANVGDIVVNSAVFGATDEVAAFEELVGSHGGLGGWQTAPFLLHPSDWPLPDDGSLVGAPAIHDVFAGWLAEPGRAPSGGESASAR